jgi:two-component system, response regulator YesN
VYSVFLVDDDLPVLEYLRTTMPWERLNCVLRGTFQDPLEALAAAQTGAPDILVTDIGMPGMDGLALIRAIQALQPDLKAIILSCHDDFHYAQQALKLKVNDYVLKETMTAELIEELLRQLCIHLDAEGSTNKLKLQMERKLHQNNSVLRQSFMTQTIQAPILDAAGWEAEALEYGLSFGNHKEWILVFGYPVRPREAIGRFHSADLLQYSVENIISELGKSRGWISFPFHDGEFYQLTPFSSSNSIRDWHNIEETLRKQQDDLKQYGKVTYSFLISSPFKDLRGLRDFAARAHKSKDERFYLPEASILRMDKLQPVSGSNDDLLTEYVSALEDFRRVVFEEKEDEVNYVVKKWGEYLRYHRVSPLEVKEWILKLVLEIRLRLKSLQSYQSNFSSEQLHHHVMELANVQELGEWLRTYLVQSIEWSQSLSRESKNREVIECKRFVAGRWGEKVSLEDAASHLHLHPNYLSRLFKRETGENFVEYVTRNKMEKAKEFLELTDKSVEEISIMLAYENKNYFTKVFKAHFGRLPSAFRSNSKK